MMLQVLVVEDDASTDQNIRGALNVSNYKVTHVPDLSKVLQFADENEFDAIILDRVINGSDSVDSVRQWRDAGVDAPLLLSSELATLQDRLEGLDAGADSYLSKPFEADELDARLRALIRMKNRYATCGSGKICVGPLSVDRQRREARYAGRLLALPPREFRLLEELARFAGHVVPRSTLIENVWNAAFGPEAKVIESNVSRLRTKLEHAGFTNAITTVRGFGYRLRVADL